MSQQECCICDPVKCAADETGEHCVDSRCAFCLHGCPAVGDEGCCEAWKR